MTDLPFARLRRSAPVLAIFDGSSQLQLDELWRHAAAWRAAGSLSRPRALEVLTRLRAATTGPFEPHADDAGETAETTPPAVLAAFAADVDAVELAPFATAATIVRDAAGAARQATQSVRFRVSDAAARLWTVAALVEALVTAPDDAARRVLASTLALYAVETATPLAATVVELAPGGRDVAFALLAAAAQATRAREVAYDALVSIT
jgi:hypothetical protein